MKSSKLIIILALCVLFWGCASIDDPAATKIALYDEVSSSRLANKESLSGTRDEKYYERWEKIYLDRGLSENEAKARAADKHYFKYQEMPLAK